MRSFDEKTDDLLRQLGTPGSAVAAQQGDRVFNFHYSPKEWASLRAYLPKIKHRLERLGYTTHFHSFADIISEILESEGGMQMKAMIAAETKAKLPQSAYTQTLQYFLTRTAPNHPLTLDSPIVLRLTEIIDKAAKSPKSIVLFTDTEMLHPLLRVSAFEQILQGKFSVPTVFFYPGLRGTIGDNPRFLGFYNSDGNYRSTHIY